MPLVVQKYGGKSLATPKHIQSAAQRIRGVRETGKEVVVVVSAMGRMTDRLIALARRTVKNPPQREMDMLMTVGERISMALLAMSLEELGVPAISFTGSQSGIVTSSDHTDARIIDIKATRIREELARGRVVIIAGFQGVSREREITTLGRGGSDTTAVALAAALGAEVCEILTDVDGLFSADPKLVPAAHLLETCTYEEALELASLGAKMHPRSVEMAKRYKVSVRIASSARAEIGGTFLHEAKTSTENKKDSTMEQVTIRGIATKDGYHYFKVKTGLSALLALTHGHRVPLRFFSCTDHEVSLVCEGEKAAGLDSLLTKHGIAFEHQDKIAIVSAVGEGLSASSEDLPRFSQALETVGAKAFLICANSLSITAAIPSTFKQAASASLHSALIESRP